MTRPGSIRFVLTGIFLLGSFRASWAQTTEGGAPHLPPASARQVVFREDIFPLLQERCFECHQGRDAKAGYRLDLREEILGATNGHPLVEIGNSADSRLIHLVSGLGEETAMPPEGERLTVQEIALLRAWIDQGLAWDHELLPAFHTGTTHWAFQPVRRPVIPLLKQDWVRTSVDAFVADLHNHHGLVPAPPATRSELIRRLTFDLTGLPATTEEVDRFVADDSPDAYEQLVERLLASPRYGERWGRHWLDVARWADSEGFEYDFLRPFAWRYRDYVIESFNIDRPYDEFIRQQIAGDELLPYTDENLIATGFLAAARYSSNEEDFAVKRNDVLVDITNATASAFLGLTLNCAQCHNHKFDPISQRDYYRFYGFFVKGQVNDLLLKDAGQWKEYEAAVSTSLSPIEESRDSLLQQVRSRLVEQIKKKLSPDERAALKTPEDELREEQRRLVQKVQKRLAFTIEELKKAFSEQEEKRFQELTAKIKQFVDEHPKPQTIGFYSPASSMTPVEVKQLRAMFPLPYEPERLKQTQATLLIRGDPHRPGPTVGVGWPAVLGPTPVEPVSKVPRTALADWMASPSNPLISRVWANRIWKYHFGRGLVETADDFGVNGATPSHPKLLDHLASQLMDSGWSTKHLHRLIVNSTTYRQSSRGSRVNVGADPENRYVWQWLPRRLEAEAIRDTLLAISGELDFQMGGASVPLAGVDDDYKFNNFELAKVTESEYVLRRSVYLEQRREVPPPMQLLFDGPNSKESCSHRHTSTVSLQPLFLLNSQFVLNRARAFATRVVAEAGPAPHLQIRRAFRIALGRSPDDSEWDALVSTVGATTGWSDAPGGPNGDQPPAKLVHFCHLLMNLNEFIYVP